jgi:hypothetical protein
MIENHVCNRSDQFPEGFMGTTNLTISKGCARARGREILFRAKEGVPVTIPGNLAQDEARAKFEVAPRRTPFDLHVSHFFLSQNHRCPKFC